MVRKNALIIIILLMIVTVSLLAQDSVNEDKYTTVNIMIKTVYSTSMGLIIEYYSRGKIRRLYLPNKFFNEKTAVRIKEDAAFMTPQMNIVFKNKEAYKVKLYMPTYIDGFTYQVINFMTNELIEKFNSTDKLTFELKDEKPES